MIEIRIKKQLIVASGPTELEVDLQIPRGELLALTGPSGAGKTTLLRIVAGLLRPEQGFIQCEGVSWLDTRKRYALRPQDRNVGLVFQDYALFPNMTVRGNLCYALQRGESRRLVDELMATTELTALAGRYPHQLSGGQQQRVALARALVRRPRLLLLDEPLSALDFPMRRRLQDYLREVHQQYELTTILVSHSKEEVKRLADRVIRMEEGKIIEPEAPSSARPNDRLILRGTVRWVTRKKDYWCVGVAVAGQEREWTTVQPWAAQLSPGDAVVLETATPDIRLLGRE